MAKFSVSGKDEFTGQFYYMRTWTGVKCLCGFDHKQFIQHLTWYDISKFNLVNLYEARLMAEYLKTLRVK